MKKLLFLAALSAMLTGIAEEGNSYIYWMVSEGATVRYDNGETHTGPTPISGTVYAKVKVDGAGPDNYLGIYANPGGTRYDYAPIDMSDTMPLFAGMFTSDLNKSFIIELYNSGTTFDETTWIGAATLAWNSAYVTAGGMSVASPGTVSSFQAVPEPTSGMLLLLGVAGLALRRRKQQKA